MSTLLTVIATALLSSAFTLLGAFLVFRYLLSTQLSRLREHLDQELNQIAADLEERVQSGVENGAREVLPEFREEVRQGFKEAMVDTVSGDVLTQTTQSVARKSGKVLRSILFGESPDS